MQSVANDFLSQIQKEVTLTENLITREMLTAFVQSCIKSNLHLYLEDEKSEKKK